MKMRKILWATDESKESDDALDYAKLFAAAFDAEIIGVHVLRPVAKKILDMVSKRLDIDKLIQEESTNWHSRFDITRQELEHDNLKFSNAVIEPESPHEGIVDFSMKRKVDLIVMGKKGVGLKGRKQIGSNTLRVLQGSRIPVLAVKTKLKRALPAIKKILVPLDVAEDFSSALEYALSLGKDLNAQINVVYVEELISYPYEFPVAILDDMRNFYDKQLRTKVNELVKKQKNKIKIEYKVVESITSFLGIIRFAELAHSDLIIMNTHGRKGLKKLFLGSVAEKVINEAPCPVLAIRP